LILSTPHEALQRLEAGERWRRIEEKRADQLQESRLAQRLARERAALATPHSGGDPQPHDQSPSTAAAAVAASTVRSDEYTGAAVYANGGGGSAGDSSGRNGGDRGSGRGGGGRGGANGLEVVPPPYLEKISTATSLALSQMSDGYDEVRIGQCACARALCPLLPALCFLPSASCPLLPACCLQLTPHPAPRTLHPAPRALHPAPHSPHTPSLARTFAPLHPSPPPASAGARAHLRARPQPQAPRP
jgi:hypothetical protein